MANLTKESHTVSELYSNCTNNIALLYKQSTCAPFLYPQNVQSNSAAKGGFDYTSTLQDIHALRDKSISKTLDRLDGAISFCIEEKNFWNKKILELENKSHLSALESEQLAMARSIITKYNKCLIKQEIGHSEVLLDPDISDIESVVVMYPMDKHKADSALSIKKTIEECPERYGIKVGIKLYDMKTRSVLDLREEEVLGCIDNPSEVFKINARIHSLSDSHGRSCNKELRPVNWRARQLYDKDSPSGIII